METGGEFGGAEMREFNGNCGVRGGDRGGSEVVGGSGVLYLFILSSIYVEQEKSGVNQESSNLHNSQGRTFRISFRVAAAKSGERECLLSGV